MKIKIIIISFLNIFICTTACNKSDTPTGETDLPTLEQKVIDDFVNKTALPQYNNLVDAATDLSNSLIALNSSPTDSNLHRAQASWKSIIC